jgi:hypothetical protein
MDDKDDIINDDALPSTQGTQDNEEHRHFASIWQVPGLERMYVDEDNEVENW